MQSKSKLCILFLTYNRMQYAEPCLKAVIENVKYSGELHIHIADDGSPAEYRNYLREIAGGYSKVDSAGISNSERRGYGANYNLSTQYIHPWCDFVLVVEDDWLLVKELDVDCLVGVFSDPRVGCLRLGYLGATQALRGEFARIDNKPLWLLDGKSSEPHVFAGHPRIETVAWQKEAGPWPELNDPNMVEFAVAHYVRKNIAWPGWINPDGDSYFTHIGSERAR